MNNEPFTEMNIVKILMDPLYHPAGVYGFYPEHYEELLRGMKQCHVVECNGDGPNRTRHLTDNFACALQQRKLSLSQADSILITSYAGPDYLMSDFAQVVDFIDRKAPDETGIMFQMFVQEQPDDSVQVYVVLFGK
ncbi:MAG: hypothetical protein JXX14_01275 [Deltaproteobacteria bacterium]|nr:hypothetical protein [Deltaproteobacteria bacterium]